MAKVFYQGKIINTNENETILDACLRQGVTIPFSCRNGVCHTCKHKTYSKKLTEISKKGLSQEQSEMGMFLPCTCVPCEDMDMVSLEDVNKEELQSNAVSIIQEKGIKGDSHILVLEPTLLVSPTFGQFIDLIIPIQKYNIDGTYTKENDVVITGTVTNNPSEDYYYELTIPRVINNFNNSLYLNVIEKNINVNIFGPYSDNSNQNTSVNIDEPKNEPTEEYSQAVDDIIKEVKKEEPHNSDDYKKYEKKGMTGCPFASKTKTKDKFPPKDLELWNALEQGKILRKLLTNFYTQVYKDDLLAPFFHGTTIDRSIEKVYSFMAQVCTGEEGVYFGDMPKNGHHWMVISPEIYEYREKLMMKCHKEEGLSDEMSKRYMAIENYYKDDIIKEKAFNKVFGGVEIPVEGFGDMVIDSGTMCDACNRVIEPGEKIKYHLRIGTVYCSDCQK